MQQRNIENQRPTLRLTDEGRMRIDRARSRKGNGKAWTTYDERWLQAASKLYEPETDWDKLWNENPNIFQPSLATLKRFLRKTYIQREFFISLCEAVGEDWQEVADLNSPSIIGDPPKLSNVYGRTTAFTQLKEWITNQEQQLVILHGRAGIGKTVLTRKVIETIANRFEFVIWFSLESSPPLQSLLDLVIPYWSSEQSQSDQRLERNTAELMLYLRQYRCLIVLDNWETVMENSRIGQDPVDCQEYADFLTIISRDRHKSCFLVLSRENPWNISLEQANEAVKSYPLRELTYEEDSEILKAEGLTGTPLELRSFMATYSNPLLLKWVARLIRAVHGGRISNVVDKGSTLLANDDISRHIYGEFCQLSGLEQSIVYWLAIWYAEQIPVSYEQLRQCISPSLDRLELDDALYSLIARRSIVRVKSDSEGYLLESVTLRCIMQQFVSQNSGELTHAIQNQAISGSEIFVNYAFITHQEDDLRHEQLRRIVKRTVEQLSGQFQTLSQIQVGLERLQSSYFAAPTKVAPTHYAQQNIAHLLAVLE